MTRSPIAHILLLIAFVINTICPMDVWAYVNTPLQLPKSGTMVHLSAPMNSPILKGIKVHADNPFRFDFILDKGDVGNGRDRSLTDESTRLIKYFLASLTVPEKDLWVNLSPYEKDRIVPESFGATEMGRDLLAQDYLLKQITASLIYPEDELGKKFWRRVYEEAQAKYGTTNIPVNTFNKVWIVPEKAVVYENTKAGTAYVVESKLKVMLEADYLSMSKHDDVGAITNRPQPGRLITAPTADVNQIGFQIVREIVLPALEREVNTGANFAQLRQVYNSLILATWYKKKIKSSILSQVYADQNKVAGVGYNNSVGAIINRPNTGRLVTAPTDIDQIYNQYLQAFKKGVYNYIKEEPDPGTGQAIPRKYFSGGFNMAMSTPITYAEAAQLPAQPADLAIISAQISELKSPAQLPQDQAMATKEVFKSISQIMNKPTDYHWLKHKEELPNLVGSDLGETNRDGAYRFKPRSFFPFTWPALSKDDATDRKGWRGTVVAQTVYPSFFEFTVIYKKDNQKDIPKIYQIGRVKRELPGRDSAAGQTIEALDISSKLGLLFMKEITKQNPKKFKELAYDLTGLRLGAPKDGAYFFTVNGVVYKWENLGFTDNGWEGRIISSFNYSNFLEFTVEFTKSDETPRQRTFQVTEQKRIIGKEEFLTISPKAGLKAIQGLMLDEAPVFSSLKGLLLGHIGMQGEVEVAIPGFDDPVVINILGFKQKKQGWQGRIKSHHQEKDHHEIVIEFFKEGRIGFERVFKIGPEQHEIIVEGKKVYRMQPLLKAGRIIREDQLGRDDLIQKMKEFIAAGQLGPALRLLRTQVGLNRIMGVTRFTRWAAENIQQGMESRTFESFLLALKERYEHDGRLTSQEIEDLLRQIRDVQQGAIEQKKVLKEKRIKARWEAKKSQQREALSGEELAKRSLEQYLSHIERLSEEEAQKVWELQDHETLFLGLMYLIQDIIKDKELGGAYYFLKYDESFSAGVQILRDGLQSYSPAEHKDSIVEYLSRLLKEGIPAALSREGKSASPTRLSLDAPVGDSDSQELGETLAAPEGISHRTLNDFLFSLEIVEKRIQEYADQFNGEIIHLNQKNTMVEELKNSSRVQEIFHFLAQRNTQFGAYLSGQWGHLAFTRIEDPTEMTITIQGSLEEVEDTFRQLARQLEIEVIEQEGVKVLRLNYQGQQNVLVHLVSSADLDSQETGRLFDIFSNGILVSETSAGVIKIREAVFHALGENATEHLFNYYMDFMHKQREVLDGFDADEAMIKVVTPSETVGIPYWSFVDPAQSAQLLQDGAMTAGYQLTSSPDDDHEKNLTDAQDLRRRAGDDLKDIGERFNKLEQSLFSTKSGDIVILTGLMELLKSVLADLEAISMIQGQIDASIRNTMSSFVRSYLATRPWKGAQAVMEKNIKIAPSYLSLIKRGIPFSVPSDEVRNRFLSLPNQSYENLTPLREVELSAEQSYDQGKRIFLKLLSLAVDGFNISAMRVWSKERNNGTNQFLKGLNGPISLSNMRERIPVLEELQRDKELKPVIRLLKEERLIELKGHLTKKIGEKMQQWRKGRGVSIEEMFKDQDLIRFLNERGIQISREAYYSLERGVRGILVEENIVAFAQFYGQKIYSLNDLEVYSEIKEIRYEMRTCEEEIKRTYSKIKLRLKNIMSDKSKGEAKRLAYEMGISESTMSRWAGRNADENDQIELQYMPILAQKLDVDIKDLLGNIEEYQFFIFVQDQAMNTGGIDLTSDKALQVQNSGEAITFKMDPAMLKQLQDASGFTPVIINIMPLANLKEFLGVI